MDELHYLRELTRLQENLITAQRVQVEAVSALMEFHRPTFDRKPALAVVRGGKQNEEV